MSRTVALLLLLGLVLASPASAADYASLQVQPYDPPRPAPPFALPDLDGKMVRLDELKGKLTMLFFWATWCPDCREELPAINRSYMQLRDRGLEVLLINMREDAETVRRVVRERGYTAPVLLDTKGTVAGRDYGVWGPPTVYFVDRLGRLAGRAVGARNWERPEARVFLQALLDNR
jgi:peroxiredoxin